MAFNFDSIHINTIICLPNSVVCQVSCQTNHVSTNLCEKAPKTLKKPQKHKLVCSFKHIIIVSDFNHFNKITYTKQFCVPSFAANKPCLNHYIRESAKNAVILKKRNLARNIQHMTIIFDSNLLKKITNAKQCCVPCFVPNQPRFHHFIRQSEKNGKKNLKNTIKHVISSI